MYPNSEHRSIASTSCRERTMCQKSENGCPICRQQWEDGYDVHSCIPCLCICCVDRPVLVCELLRYCGFVYWVRVIRACRGSLFSYPSTLLSDHCPTVVLVLYDLEHCPSRACKNPIFLLLLVPMQGSRVDCVRTTDRSAFTKGKD
jgi:hypothetical protein